MTSLVYVEYGELVHLCPFGVSVVEGAVVFFIQRVGSTLVWLAPYGFPTSSCFQWLLVLCPSNERKNERKKERNKEQKKDTNQERNKDRTKEGNEENEETKKERNKETLA